MATLTVPAATKTLSSIAISPPNASVAAGSTEQFTAMATYSDGSTANVTAMASWTAANTAVATINSAGLATAIAAGSTTITASVSGVSGMATLTVPAATKTLSSIAVSPPSASVAAGADTAVHCDGDIQRRLDGQRDRDGKLDSRERSRRDDQFGWIGHCDRRGFDHHHRFCERRQWDGDADRSAPKTVTSLAVSQTSASFAVGATEQFTATATYSDGSTANVTATAAWTVANESVATIDPAGLATGVAAGATTVSASLDGVSGDTSLIVTIAPGTGVNIATWHADNNRSGLNPGEQSLSPSNVSPQTFGKLFSYLVDGYVYGEPLLVSNLTINGSTHNVLYAATENDSVYAFDADNYGNGTPLWQVSLLEPGETPVTNNITILPYIGVTSTPVIDLTSNTMYVVSAQIPAGGGASTFRLNALDITSGAKSLAAR